PQHRNKADETGTSDLFQTATPDADVADQKCEKPNNDGHCGGVADAKGGSGEKKHMRGAGKADDPPHTRPGGAMPALGPDSLDEHGMPLAGNGGTEPGLSRRRIRELADWYKDETHRRYYDGTLDVPALDAELRAILREEVDLPEHVEIEFKRVMGLVFAM